MDTFVCGLLIPGIRPEPFYMTNHDSCNHLKLSSYASEALSQEEPQGLIACPPQLLVRYSKWKNRLGLIPAGHNLSALFRDSINSPKDYVRTSFD
jgi:hypothetical protein